MRGRTALAGLALAAGLASAALAAMPGGPESGVGPGADTARIGSPAGTASGELATLVGALSKDELGYRLTTEDGGSYVLDVSDAQRNPDELVGSAVRLTGMVVEEAPAAASGSSATSGSSAGPSTGPSAGKSGVIRVKDLEPAPGAAEGR